MTQVNIIQDLSSYTKVPSKALNELVEKSMLCIGSAIHDAKMMEEDTIVINIGIGALSVELNSMQCKFTPNKELKKVISQSLINKIDPLEYALEQTIIDKLIAICEEAI